MRFTRNFVTMNFPLLSEDEESFNEYKLACILLMKKQIDIDNFQSFTSRCAFSPFSINNMSLSNTENHQKGYFLTLPLSVFQKYYTATCGNEEMGTSEPLSKEIYLKACLQAKNQQKEGLEEYSYVDVEISPNVLKFIEKYNDDKIKKTAEKVREKALRGLERRIRFCNFFLKVKNAIIVGE